MNSNLFPDFSLKQPRRMLSGLAIAMVFFASCGLTPSPQFQKVYNLPKASWETKFNPEFIINIDDTAAAYQIFLLIRHTDAYPFSNIWIGMDSQSPGDSSWAHARVEVPLAAPSGQWLGRGAGELWEQRVPINSPDQPAFFPKTGTYKIRLKHEMRRNPLPEILTVGLRLEKLPPFRKS